MSAGRWLCFHDNKVRKYWIHAGPGRVYLYQGATHPPSTATSHVPMGVTTSFGNPEIQVFTKDACPTLNCKLKNSEWLQLRHNKLLTKKINKIISTKTILIHRIININIPFLWHGKKDKKIKCKCFLETIHSWFKQEILIINSHKSLSITFKTLQVQTQENEIVTVPVPYMLMNSHDYNSSLLYKGHTCFSSMPQCINTPTLCNMAINYTKVIYIYMYMYIYR